MSRMYTLFYFLLLFLLTLPGSGLSGQPPENDDKGAATGKKSIKLDSDSPQTDPVSQTLTVVPGNGLAPMIIGNCQEIEYDLAIIKAENKRLLLRTIELSDANRKLQNVDSKLKKSKTENTFPYTLAELEKKLAVTKNQLEQTSKKYNILIEEFEKRGKKIADLQSLTAKQDDKTRFLWFVAGAIVFFVGLLAGKTGNRQKKKFSY